MRQGRSITGAETGECRNFLSLLGIEPQFLGHPTCILVTIFTELAQIQNTTDAVKLIQLNGSLNFKLILGKNKRSQDYLSLTQLLPVPLPFLNKIPRPRGLSCMVRSKD
jgi:hypothetical protein